MRNRCRWIGHIVLVWMFLIGASWAAEPKSILLANEEALRAASVQFVEQFADLMPVGIDADYASAVVITDEGRRIAFNNLFTDGSLKDSAALKVLSDEYRPDALILIWVVSEATTSNAAYGLEKRAVTVQLRVVDPRTGKNIVTEVVSHETGFAMATQETAATRAALLKQAIAKFDVESIRTALSAHFDRAKALGVRLKLTIKNLNQREYFAKRAALLQLVRKAGASERLLESYDEASRVLVLRGNCRTNLDAFYRALYWAAVSAPVLENFSLKRKGSDQEIILTRLPPERKKLIITGLRNEWYHSRLSAYRDALRSLSGVKDIKFSHVPGSGASGQAKAVFTFTHSGDLAQLEERLWGSLKSSGKVPNRKLVSISKKTIVYRSQYTSGDRSTVRIVFRNVSPTNYRDIGVRLDRIIRTLGVTNIRKDYDPNLSELSFYVDAAITASEMDLKLWAEVLKDKALENIVQDYTHDAVVAYSYFRPEPRVLRVTMRVENLGPEDYAENGRLFVRIVKAISGVSNVVQTYHDDDRTLILTFSYAGLDVRLIDDAVWAAARERAGLRKLAMGSISGSEIVYFFAGEGAINRVTILMRGVTGRDYKRISTGFADLLKGMPGVREVRYSYEYSARTICFELSYEGENLFSLEDAIQRATLTSPQFMYVARGPTVSNRLVYHYYDSPMEKLAASESEDVADDASYQRRRSDISGLVERYDPSVVTVHGRGRAQGGTRAWHGTGFIVNPKGYVITNARVVPNADRIFVRTFDGQLFRAILIKQEPELDIALLKIKTPRSDFPAVEIGRASDVRKGDTILMIGTPLDEEFEHSAVTGIISGKDRRRGLMQVSIPIYPGDNGSPVILCRTGTVIGIASGHRRMDASQNNTKMGLIIPINHAKGLLDIME